MVGFQIPLYNTFLPTTFNIIQCKVECIPQLEIEILKIFAYSEGSNSECVWVLDGRMCWVSGPDHWKTELASLDCKEKWCK